MDAAEESHADLLLNFQEICAADDESANAYLIRFDWNLEMAIQEYLNEKEGRPSAVRGTVHDQDASGSEPEVEEVARVLVRPPARHSANFHGRPPETWFQWCCSLAMLPFRFTVYSLWDLFSFVYSLFFTPFTRQITHPVEDVRLFREQFVEKYGESQLKFHEGSYSQATDEAKNELKFLLVYLHNTRNQAADQFCRDVLCSPDVIRFLNTNVIFWGCSVGSGEGYRVSTAMRENTYPFLALVCLQDGRMSVVLRREGLCSGAEMIGFLGVAIQQNQGHLTRARQERETSKINAELRKQQEDEYQHSLLLDREKERQRLEEVQEEDRIKAESQRLAVEQDALMENIKQKRVELLAQLPPEPSAEAADCVRVSLRFPSGTRLERRFLSSDSLKLLHQVTFCHPECPDKFSIVTNYPRRTLQCVATHEGDTTETFAQAGLDRAVMLLVVDTEA